MSEIILCLIFIKACLTRIGENDLINEEEYYHRYTALDNGGQKVIKNSGKIEGILIQETRQLLLRLPCR